MRGHFIISQNRFGAMRRSLKYVLFNINIAIVTIAIPAHAEDASSKAQSSAAPNENDAPRGNHNHASHAGARVLNGVVSLDVFADGDGLHLLTGKKTGAGVVLLHQSSKDNGESWSNDAAVQGPPDAGANVSRGADARIVAAKGALIALWTSRVENAPYQAGPLVSARSIDGGKTWTPGAIPADWSAGSHGFHTLATDGKTLHAVWLDSRDGKSGVPGSQGLRYAYSTDGGVRWAKNITLDDVSCACCWTTGKVDAGGKFFVLYRDKQPSDMAIGVVDPKTRHWTRLSTVGAFGWDFPGCPHIGGGIAFRKAGKTQEIHAVVGTRKKGDAGIYHLRSSDGGKSWMEPLRLGDETATHADIAVGRNGRLAAVWDMIDPQANDGSVAIYASLSDDGVNWTSPAKLSISNVMASHPRIVPAQDAFRVLWTEQTEGKESSVGSARLGGGLASK